MYDYPRCLRGKPQLGGSHSITIGSSHRAGADYSYDYDYDIYFFENYKYIDCGTRGESGC